MQSYTACTVLVYRGGGGAGGVVWPDRPGVRPDRSGEVSGLS